MEWVKHHPGKTRSQVISELTHEALLVNDQDDHIWIVKMNNRGTSLICFAVGKVDGIWHHKMIAEDIGPDIYDCPLEMLDMTVPRNEEWRQRVRRHHAEAQKKAQESQG